MFAVAAVVAGAAVLALEIPLLLAGKASPDAWFWVIIAGLLLLLGLVDLLAPTPKKQDNDDLPLRPGR